MDYRVSGVMNHNVISINSSNSLPEMESMVGKHRISGFPVVDDGKLVGVVTTSDLVGNLCPAFDANRVASSDAELGNLIASSAGEVASAATVAEIMTRDPITVAPNDLLHDAADLMYEHRIHRVFVVDDSDVVGVLTPFDFVRLYATDRLRAGSKPKTLDF